MIEQIYNTHIGTAQKNNQNSLNTIYIELLIKCFNTQDYKILEINGYSRKQNDTKRSFSHHIFFTQYPLFRGNI